MGCGVSKPEVQGPPAEPAPHYVASTNGLSPLSKAGAVKNADTIVVSSTDGKGKAPPEVAAPAAGHGNRPENGGGGTPSGRVSSLPDAVPERRAESLHDSPMSSTAGSASRSSPFQSGSPLQSGSHFQTAASPFDNGGEAAASTTRKMVFQSKGDEHGVEFIVSAPHPSSPDYQGPPLASASAERARCHALRRLGIDMESPEPTLDFITKLCTNICAVPLAFITFVDDKYTYIKSSSVEEHLERQPTDRRISLTSWVLVPLKPEVLVVEDLSKDTRFAMHPFVRARPPLLFMAAAPLLDASGQRLGALSVIDYKPRKFDAEQCNVLCNFAEMVMREVQRLSESGVQRAMSLNPTPENEQLLRTMDACSDGVVLLDVRMPRWPVLFSNQGWMEVTGLPAVSGSVKFFWDMFQLPGVSGSKQPWELYEGAVEAGEIFTLDVIASGSSGKHLFPITFKPASTEHVDSGMVSISIPAQSAPAPPTPSRQARLFYFGTLTRPEEGGTIRNTTGSVTPTSSSSLAQPEDDVNLLPIPGVKLGPLLGKGSFGSVYYGTWNGAQIAVKVIQHMATEAERRARDEQLEAILGLKMMHPNIVRTFQFSTKDRTGTRQPSTAELLRREMLQGDSAMSSASDTAGTPTGQRRMMETWIVLELCNRGSLQDAIDKGAFRSKGTTSLDGQPNMLNITRTATEIAGAMSYLHSLDILHSDLNGNNILLISNTGIDDRPFSVKVSDFGLSRIHIGERTVATQTYGTVTHMPPELLSEGRLSKAADVYAFGVLLWEMYTGQRPWAGLRHVQVITHKMRHGSQLKWPPTVNPAFKEVAQRCMSPDPHERPTFSEVLDILEPLRQAAELGELESFPAVEPKPSMSSQKPGWASQKPVSTLLGPVEQIPE